MKSHAVVVLLLLVLKECFGGNILFISGIPSPSHHHYNRVLAVELAGKGHNVTFISLDLPKKETPNLHYVYLDKVYDVFYSEDIPDILDFADTGVIVGTLMTPLYYTQVCKGIVVSEGLNVILNYPDDFKFDVVIYDFTFGPCLLPLLHKFNYPPLISISAFANPPYTTDYVGGHKHPSYVPHFAVTYSRDMTFFQRFFNSFIYTLDWALREFVMTPQMEAKARERFNFDFPPLKELAKKTSLIFVNTDNGIDFPEPLEPNMIQVGGLQILPAKLLPEEMAKFIKSGKKGTILMSLGTNIKSNMLGDKILGYILETFAQLSEYNFLWKFESEIEDLPAKLSSNVMIDKFLPQNDILAQPNLIAFITHSGMLSTHEALWHGKPMIGIPFFVDQDRNMEKMRKLGIGERVAIKTISPEVFKETILRVVEDPSYSKNAKKISKRFQDKPQKSLDTAVWWIEYAMRNPDLEYLKSPTVKLGTFASRSYDVLLAVIAIFHVCVFVTIRLFRKCFKKLCRSSKKNKTE